MALNSVEVSRLTQTWEVSETYISKMILYWRICVKAQCVNGNGIAPTYFLGETDFNWVNKPKIRVIGSEWPASFSNKPGKSTLRMQTKIIVSFMLEGVMHCYYMMFFFQESTQEVPKYSWAVWQYFGKRTADIHLYFWAHVFSSCKWAEHWNRLDLCCSRRAARWSQSISRKSNIKKQATVRSNEQCNWFVVVRSEILLKGGSDVT